MDTPTARAQAFWQYVSFLFALFTFRLCLKRDQALQPACLAPRPSHRALVADPHDEIANHLFPQGCQ